MTGTTGTCLNPVPAWQPSPVPGCPAPSAAHCGLPPHYRPVGAFHLCPGGPAPLTATALQPWLAPLVPLGPLTSASPGTPPLLLPAAHRPLPHHSSRAPRCSRGGLVAARGLLGRSLLPWSRHTTSTPGACTAPVQATPCLLGTSAIHGHRY
ncbi:hypothetical protein NDU88_009245 [Pleurodeles waltl]|uniref:Uncharacterized protein n=1 Tax=Pleurodeles waltl TaxID=8319 RepID=A0AAV7RVK4_PLEWA|nr:hypothetical protein NDU88_009245 [Pleurodeles waltl]